MESLLLNQNQESRPSISSLWQKWLCENLGLGEGPERVEVEYLHAIQNSTLPKLRKHKPRICTMAGNQINRRHMCNNNAKKNRVTNLNKATVCLVSSRSSSFDFNENTKRFEAIINQINDKQTHCHRKKNYATIHMQRGYARTITRRSKHIFVSRFCNYSRAAPLASQWEGYVR